MVTSIIGEGDSVANVPIYERFLFPTFLRGEMKDKEAMESTVEASELDWNIVRPPFLTDGSATGHKPRRAPGGRYACGGSPHTRGARGHLSGIRVRYQPKAQTFAVPHEAGFSFLCGSSGRRSAFGLGAPNRRYQEMRVICCAGVDRMPALVHRWLMLKCRILVRIVAEDIDPQCGSRFEERT